MPCAPDEHRTYAMMAKPVGSACNLACDYCYYRKAGTAGLMGDDVLRAYIAQTIAMHGRKATVEFVWHGGEPLLAGVDFFQRAVDIEREHGRGRTILNNVQTNGTLIDEEWAAFFKRNRFIVGVSCDGPKALHDAFRRDASGAGSFDATMRGVEACRAHGVRVDGLCAVHAGNVGRPLEVYEFLKANFPLVHFLPVCDPAPPEARRAASASEPGPGAKPGPGTGQEPASRPGHAAPGPASASGQGPGAAPAAPFRLSPESVDAGAYGAFLRTVFDAWHADDPRTRPAVAQFEALRRMLDGQPAGTCELEAVCGHAGSVESNGDVYSCDRFADDAHRIGNVLDGRLDAIMERNRPFGMEKAYGLPPECFACEHVRLCFGGCPAKRLPLAPSRRTVPALCGAYRAFFSHCAPKIAAQEGALRAADTRR